MSKGFLVSAVLEDVKTLALDDVLSTLGPMALIAAPPPAENREWSFRTVSLGHTHMMTESGRHIILRAEDWIFPVKPAVGRAFANTLLVGRASTNDILLEHSSVSKLHSRLVLEPEGGYRIFDAESSNGTKVDDVPVPKEGTLLVEGNVLEWGICTAVLVSNANLKRMLKSLIN